jgi:hypothetical protein
MVKFGRFYPKDPKRTANIIDKMVQDMLREEDEKNKKRPVQSKKRKDM